MIQTAIRIVHSGISAIKIIGAAILCSLTLLLKQHFGVFWDKKWGGCPSFG